MGQSKRWAAAGVVITVMLAGCAGSSASPAPTQPESSGLTELDMTVTAQAAAGHTGPTDFDLTATAQSAVPPTTSAPPGEIVPSAEAWTMFHHDANHSGAIGGAGDVDASTGPVVRWTYTLVPQAELSMRWASSFPLGDLDGDGTLEVVVTSPDGAPTLSPRVVVLKDTPGQEPPVRVLWEFVLPGTDAGVDQYSAGLADCDGDGLLDVAFSARDGLVRCLKGTNGELIWQYQTNRIMESGPMIADLEGDGTLELVQVTDCLREGCTPGGALLVFAAQGARGGAENPPLWSMEFPWKSDSAEPAIADIAPDDGTSRLAIIMGTWGGRELIVWRDASGQIIVNELDLRTLDPDIPADSPVVSRSSPMVADFGSGPTIVFGWMPNFNIYPDARWSAVRVTADMDAGTVSLDPVWTQRDDVWKSSTGLVTNADGSQLVVSGYGIGEGAGGGFGCDEVIGGVIARTPSGGLAWQDDLGPQQGDIRSSVAIADIDGDGQQEVLVGVGCGGELRAYDGATGILEWAFTLGPRTFGSPSIGDLDNDGLLEIIIASYDGLIYALGGG